MRRRGYARAALAARRAAVLGEIPHETVHHLEIRAIDKLSADTLLSNQPRTLKMLQVEGQRGRHQAYALTDEPGGQSLLALLNQKPIDREAMFMSKGAQCTDDLRGLHGAYDITRILVLSTCELAD